MTMKPVDMSEAYWGVSPDDPYVLKALAVHDHLNEDERRNVFRTTILAIVAYRRTGDAERLTRNLAEGMESLVHFDSRPGFREKIRAARTSTPVPASDMDVQALLQMLEDGIA